jgi:uncharacterized protein (TIGR03083 family)
LERDAVRGLYAEGVLAIEACTATLTKEQWQRPACGTWTATDLAGHLVCVVGWYHAWLDRAEAGDTAPPFSESDLDVHNEEALAALDLGAGPERIAAFTREARRYAERLDAVWDLAYGFPFGTVTAGVHAGAAAGEWHLHAWDLSRGTHRPRDPRQLFVAIGAAITAAQGGPIGRAGGAILPIASRWKPWEQLLRRSGRTTFVL